ncbi:hypothetical protein MTBPR1_70133 [Candidatus Terasakiella magnetica]|uniref:Uncharacterized protein n=1 Tax=Candidatus Terasakiella magnetica TaxID=1867952 RepID=A0A1C3RKV5_9PROT|nr:hypothetical protein [Candidatus Terasakiella magnetica]SCA57861.1 hypothetical protein MTBPR1_70133 [Candidatus Terasakiella magnetica]
MNLIRTIQSHIRNGEIGKAAQLCKSSPLDSADLCESYAICLSSMGKMDEAIIQQKKAVSLSSNDPRFYKNLGTFYALSQQPEQALKAWISCKEVHKNDPVFLHNLGTTALKSNQFQTAAECFVDVLKLDPTAPAPKRALALAYVQLDENKKALECYIDIEKSQQESVQDLYQLALVARDLDQLDICRRALERALHKEPTHIEAQYEYAQLLLREHENTKGFATFEWRLKRTGAPSYNIAPELSIGENPKGGKILIYSEQGAGDTLHFSSYLKILDEQHIEYDLLCHPSLVRYFKSYNISAIGFNQPLASYWRQCPLLSLPHRLKLDDPTQNTSLSPYIKSAKHIGLCWTGSPSFANNHLRTPGFNHFEKLIKDNQTFEWTNLVPDHLDADLNVKHVLTPQSDYLDTAHLIKSLDLVITVDTSVAHLCGQLNIPTWLILHRPPDWRWFHDEERSSLYPNIRIFKQKTPRDWTNTFLNVQHALKELNAR